MQIMFWRGGNLQRIFLCLSEMINSGKISKRVHLIRTVNLLNIATRLLYQTIQVTILLEFLISVCLLHSHSLVL